MRAFAKKPKATQPANTTKTTKPSWAPARQCDDVRSILQLHRAIDRQAAARRWVSAGDPYEGEADRAATQVMRMREPEHACAAHPCVQARRDEAMVSGQVATPPLIHEVLAAPGRPLDAPTRAFMEPRFEQNFDHVRVHNDAKAAESARTLGARAYTVGRNIVFGKEAYRPGTSSGNQLLAHELAHVVQQHSGDPGSGITAGVRTHPIPDQLSRVPSAIIQRQPLPREQFESVDYTLRRLISELNDHLNNGRTDEARALVPRIQHYLTSESLAYMLADDAAAAFLRLGMVEEGVGALEAGREARMLGHNRYSYSLRAVEMLFDAGGRHLQADEYPQAWQAYESVLQWLENAELSHDPLSLGGEATSEVREWYPRIIAALFSIPSRLRAAGNQAEAERYLTLARDRVIGSNVTHRYGADAARALIDAGRVEDAFAVLGNAELESPHTNPLIAYSEQAVMVLLESGEQAIQQQHWDVARQVFTEALRWVDERRDILGDAFYNQGRERSVVAQAVDRIMRGLLAMAVHVQQQATTAFENNAADAPQQLQTARAEIGRIRQLFRGRMTDVVIIAEIEQATPTSDTAIYRDAFAPARELSVTRYGGQDEFEDRVNSIERTLETLGNQAATIEQFYVTDSSVVSEFETRHGHRPNIHSLDDRRIFWELKFAHLLTTGLSRQDALQALINSIGGYLQAFTFHTEYNIPDAFEHALTTDFPRTTTNQALMDCGIYAMRTAYELSLVQNAAQIDFHYVFVPHHVYLGVIDRGNAFGWALSNNRFRPIRSNIGTVGVATAVSTEFNLIPSDVEGRQLTSFTESGLRGEFQQGGQGLNLPANYQSLSSSAKRRARRQSRDINNQYTRLVEQISEQSARLRVLLNTLRDEFNALSGVPTPDFNSSAEDRIMRLHHPYVTISRDTVNYLTEAGRVLGARSGTMPTPLAFYFFNMDLAMNYVVHVLGQSTLGNDEFIQDPIYERIERAFNVQYQNVQRGYQGSPPPWDVAQWERI